ncbi:MAG: hypothetical protein NZM10_04750 [Fimbriimonadales bacterium]|nr:hypothetical protein [Fimbriimonadales bacterium]MCS7190242.1 hypothetical protein [Fimbriimonadales bacterium]
MRLRCRRCNAPITLDDFLYIAYHPHTMGANRVEVHFECAHCGHRGERILSQSAWDELMLSYLENDERSVEEWMTTQQLGPITAEEIRAVRRALRHENILESLRAWERARDEGQVE